MPKGSTFKQEVRNRLISLSLIEPPLSGSEIEERLKEEFSDLLESGIPALRTIQDYMSKARDKQIGNIYEQPWSIAMLKEPIDIPWEAAGFLVQAHNVLQKRQNEGKINWAWSSNPFDKIYKGTLEEVAESMVSGKTPEPAFVKPPVELAPPGTVLTNRQAKWLWRISFIFPEWKDPRGIPNLCYIADDYTYREQLSEYLQEDFDTSDLDNSLTLIRRNIDHNKDQNKAKEETDERTYNEEIQE